MAHPHAHSQFKVFVGTSLDDISSKIQAFATGRKVAPKSIGVEYVPYNDRELGGYIVSLGYDDERVAGTSPKVKLKEVSLGKLSLSAPEAIEAALTNAASSEDPAPICHELYDTPDGDLVAVFLLHG
jgi:hypothetical protein